ncbi:unnamed protein product [Brugia pahangi]|uniref:Thioredoxin domain-containing protein n=1 Tax=Brugia pahangi TaxID=6280 RepID=A0A0N4TQV9_BRUPA|nr:unnamed protein product [Brugia pahangi]
MRLIDTSQPIKSRLTIELQTFRLTDGMFNVLLIAYLLLSVARIINGGSISGWDNTTNDKSGLPAHGIITTNIFCEYPKNAFEVLINRQCPATDPFCVVDVPFDILLNQRYRCATAPHRKDLMVNLMNSSQLLAQVNSDSDLYSGHSNCMLTAFYSPDCAFSIRMVSYLYQLPLMYPRLRIVATDARDHSKLNSRYGIIGTPTILLWVDGSVVSRMDEAPFSLKAFRDYIEKWTDLELEYMPAVENKSDFIENIQFYKSSFDWYLVVSWCSSVISIAYFFMNSKYGQAFWETFRTNYFQANDTQQ